MNALLRFLLPLAATGLLAGCRASEAKFRFAPLPRHPHVTARDVTPAPEPTAAAQPEATEAPAAPTTAAPERPALDAAPPSLEAPPPVPAPRDSVARPAPNRPTTTPPTFYAPPPKPVTNRAFLVLGVLGALGLAAFTVSVVALPIILTVGTALTALFLVGGAVVLVGRKLGKFFRKRRGN